MNELETQEVRENYKNDMKVMVIIVLALAGFVLGQYLRWGLA